MTNDQHAPEATDNAAAPDDVAEADATPVTRYSCEDGRAVLARYANTGAVNATVDLDIAGIKRQLAQGVSASGARYETDQGISPGRKLVWWSKGDGAMLIESDLDNQDGATDKTVNCDQTAETE